MSTTPEPLGTVPETPPVAVETPVVETGVTQEKYEALLARITPLEEKAAKADALEAKINEMIARPTSVASPANGVEDLEELAAYERDLEWTAQNGTAEQKRAAKYELARSAATRRALDENRALRDQLNTPESIRDDVLSIQREAAKEGNHISGKLAREILELRRKAAAPAAPAAPRPVDAPAAIAPTPVTKPAADAITYAQFRERWASATPAQQDELRKLERAGKVVPG